MELVAWVSVIALLIVIVVSCTTSVNPGLLAVVFAWMIGVYLAPSIGMKGVLAGFPVDLFLKLVGVTWLFTLAQINGTLDQIARVAVRGCRGNVGLIPIMFFALALVLGSIGPGNIAAAALVAPLAMTAAERAGIPTFLMVLMVGHGANASALSPIAPTGLIASQNMARMGLAGFEVHNYAANLLANAAVGLGGYFLFGGWRLFRRTYRESGELTPACSAPLEEVSAASEAGPSPRPEPFQVAHWITLAVIAVLLVGVVFFRVDVGMGAFAGAVVLTVLRLGDERKAVLAIPWSAILMVCGVTVLTALLEKTGGLDRLTTVLAGLSPPEWSTGLIALVTGVISVYSSTSGVVLPALLPAVPGYVEKMGGGDPVAIASSVIVGGHLVDVSPLSTIGALCIACAPLGEDRRLLFNKVLAWGLSMAVVGAIICQVCFGILRL